MIKTGFSPRVRGCSNHVDSFSNAGARFPRVCGDVPVQVGVNLMLIVVFPACAGMFLRFPLRWTRQNGFPRVCGDVPYAPL